MLWKNRNILEPIILIILKKLFGKKLCTDLDSVTNFWERERERERDRERERERERGREQINLRLLLENSEMSAKVY